MNTEIELLLEEWARNLRAEFSTTADIPFEMVLLMVHLKRAEGTL
jgi:hypothetical protein